MPYLMSGRVLACALLLVALPASSQTTCQAPFDQCTAQCGVVVMPDASGVMSLATDPNCLNQCRAVYASCSAAEAAAAQQRAQQPVQPPPQSDAEFRRQQDLHYREQQLRADEEGRRRLQEAQQQANHVQQVQACYNDCAAFTHECVGHDPWIGNQHNCQQQGAQCQAACPQNPDHTLKYQRTQRFTVIPNPNPPPPGHCSALDFQSGLCHFHTP